MGWGDRVTRSGSWGTAWGEKKLVRSRCAEHAGNRNLHGKIVELIFCIPMRANQHRRESVQRQPRRCHLTSP